MIYFNYLFLMNIQCKKIKIMIETLDNKYLKLGTFSSVGWAFKSTKLCNFNK
jgi:hypothetical protein